MLQALKLPTDNVNFLSNNQFKVLTRAFEQLHICDTCNGDKPYSCVKATISFDGQQLHFELPKCQKQLAFQKHISVNRIIENSKIPPIFRKYRATDFVKLIKTEPAILDAAEDAISNNASLFLFGDSGVGKTFLTSIIAIERAFIGKHSLFVNIPDLLEDLRDFNNQESIYTDSINRNDKLQRIYNSTCLIIDDLGAEKPSDWTCEILFKIINSRYNNARQTIISSNFDINGLNERFSKFTGTRITRRIKDICKIIQM